MVPLYRIIGKYCTPITRLSSFRKKLRFCRLRYTKFTQYIFLFSHVRLFAYLLQIIQIEEIETLQFHKKVLISNYFKHNCFLNTSERGFSKKSRGFRDAKYRANFSRAALLKKAAARHNRRVRRRF
jgi:hypothetical protein